ncbi:putative riboflavin biosynthesis protein Rib7 [Xylariaceae sp. FL0016]|nr:putative riboflavin biosynthesis protein Rib7 [Xylariaceae sp. FL0016]
MAEVPLVFPPADASRLEPHLPRLSARNDENSAEISSCSTPFVTLTFATSLDSALSLGPGIRTALSGPQSKAMTHYLRSRHDAICVGVGTAVADDPGLNCRLAAECEAQAMSPATLTKKQPRPMVIDPLLRWDFSSDSKVMQLARSGKGLAPYIITTVAEPPINKKRLLEDLGGKFLILDHPRSNRPSRGSDHGRLDWCSILAAVRAEGMQSIMIEGGGAVINSLLSAENNKLVDSVIITIAPTWLGPGGVLVSPPREARPEDQPRPAARLTDTKWLPLGEDVVLCGRIAH